mmetsp:Transcript_41600/g.87098  ORF Transcript_41600/g.87098 Transcript_41600/m.87098 type:complete len:234 (-) Transcript_41600:773-1474(-)
MLGRLPASHQLPLDRGVLVDPQDAHAKARLGEEVLQLRPFRGAAHLIHLRVEDLEQIHLRDCAREAVDQRALELLLRRELVQQHVEDLHVAHEPPLVDNLPCSWRFEERRDHYWLCGEASLVHDVRRHGALARAGGAAEEHDLRRKLDPHLATRACREAAPRLLEDHLRIADGVRVAEPELGEGSEGDGVLLQALEEDAELLVVDLAAAVEVGDPHHAVHLVIRDVAVGHGAL